MPQFAYEAMSASPATLLAPYGERGSRMWSSLMGNCLGSPYTAPVDANTRFCTPRSAQASSRLAVPAMLTSMVLAGSRTESTTLISAARWTHESTFSFFMMSAIARLSRTSAL